MDMDIGMDTDIGLSLICYPQICVTNHFSNPLSHSSPQEPLSHPPYDTVICTDKGVPNTITCGGKGWGLICGYSNCRAIMQPLLEYFIVDQGTLASSVLMAVFVIYRVAPPPFC
jgi:hypothetical protein